MKYETKFNFGDEVYQIINRPRAIWVPCSFCGEIGFIVGKDKQSCHCPECYGRKGQTKTQEGLKWQIVSQDPLTVGKIRIEHVIEYVDGEEKVYANFGDQEEDYKEEYMCYETGIGSGSVYRGTELFLTKEESQIECDKRNKKELRLNG